MLGAVPLVTALALETDLPTLLVRPDRPKDYGTAQAIEGVLERGDRVLLLEDIVTTGGARWRRWRRCAQPAPRCWARCA